MSPRILHCRLVVVKDNEGDGVHQDGLLPVCANRYWRKCSDGCSQDCKCAYLRLLGKSFQPEPLVESLFSRALKLASDLQVSVHVRTVHKWVETVHNNANTRLDREKTVSWAPPFMIAITSL